MTPISSIATFDLDADIAMSELRSEETLSARLDEHPALRLHRRNDVLAVLVTPARWREIQQVIRELEEQVEQYESAAVHAILAQRAADAHFVPADEQAWNEVTKRFHTQTS